jgi:hypothetical protein
MRFMLDSRLNGLLVEKHLRSTAPDDTLFEVFLAFASPGSVRSEPPSYNGGCFEPVMRKRTAFFSFEFARLTGRPRPMGTAGRPETRETG